MIGEKVIGDYKRLYEVDLCNVLVLANNCNFHSFFTSLVKILGRFTIVTYGGNTCCHICGTCGHWR